MRLIAIYQIEWSCFFYYPFKICCFDVFFLSRIRCFGGIEIGCLCWLYLQFELNSSPHVLGCLGYLIEDTDEEAHRRRVAMHPLNSWWQNLWKQNSPRLHIFAFRRYFLPIFTFSAYFAAARPPHFHNYFCCAFLSFNVGRMIFPHSRLRANLKLSHELGNEWNVDF